MPHAGTGGQLTVDGLGEGVEVVLGALEQVAEDAVDLGVVDVRDHLLEVGDVGGLELDTDRERLLLGLQAALEPAVVALLELIECVLAGLGALGGVIEVIDVDEPAGRVEVPLLGVLDHAERSEPVVVCVQRRVEVAGEPLLLTDERDVLLRLLVERGSCRRARRGIGGERLCTGDGGPADDDRCRGESDKDLRCVSHGPSLLLVYNPSNARAVKGRRAGP